MNQQNAMAGSVCVCVCVCVCVRACVRVRARERETVAHSSSEAFSGLALGTQEARVVFIRH
jgi:hypothetical protein